MTVERIFSRSTPGGPQTEHQAVRIVADSGIEAEEIEAFFDAQNLPRDLSVTGRNVVVRGVRLKALVGHEFTVGGLRLRGAELCEPCLGLGAKLATPTLTPAQAVKQLIAKAGLRGYALSSGEVALGAVFQDTV